MNEKCIDCKNQGSSLCNDCSNNKNDHYQDKNEFKVGEEEICKICRQIDLTCAEYCYYARKKIKKIPEDNCLNCRHKNKFNQYDVERLPHPCRKCTGFDKWTSNNQKDIEKFEYTIEYNQNSPLDMESGQMYFDITFKVKCIKCKNIVEIREKVFTDSDWLGNCFDTDITHTIDFDCPECGIEQFIEVTIHPILIIKKGEVIDVYRGMKNE